MAKHFKRFHHLPVRGPRPRLSVAQVLAWAEAHHAATGRWPSVSSGAVTGAPGESWGKIYKALRRGHRGLPSRMSPARLFAGHQAPLVLSQVVGS